MAKNTKKSQANASASRPTPKKKKKSVKKNTSKATAATKPKEKDPISHEAAVVLFCGLAVVLFLIFLKFPPTAVSQGAGFLCVYISRVFAMIFGKGRFVLTFYMLYLAFLKWNHQKEGFPFRRCLVASTVLFLALVTFFNIDQTLLSFGNFIAMAAQGNMGGVIGGLLSYALLVPFGKTISVMILLIVNLAAVIAVTGLSIFGLAHKIQTASGEAIARQKQKISDKKAQNSGEESVPAPSAKKKKSPDPAYSEEVPRSIVGKGGIFRRVAALFSGKNKTEDVPAWDNPVSDDAENLLEVDFQGNLQEFTASDDVAVGSFYTHLAGGEENIFTAQVSTDAPDDEGAKKLLEEELTETEEEIAEAVTIFDTIEPDIPDEESNDDLIAAGEDSALSVNEEEADGEDDDLEIPEYTLPSTSLLPKITAPHSDNIAQTVKANAEALKRTMESFGVKAEVTNATVGPSLIRYEVQPAPGVKVSKIVNLADDIALQLAATDVRMEAPIPGKSVIGIEVPRKEKVMVQFRDILENSDFFSRKSKLSFALGKDIAGNTILGDLAEMPHLLVAGTTGSGKSVCINSIICSILFKANPGEVKFIMVDPKQVEFVIYDGLPHLITPVVTDPKRAAGALKWALREMENRYTLLNQNRVRNIEGYNALVGDNEEKLPQIVIFIDELADLMMVAAKEVEDTVCRLAQKARAAGIHLVIATQRPTVNVVTGLIKANIPSRIALSVSSQMDSRTILDMGGAEKLMGKGDMLYSPVGMLKPLRVQGAFLDENMIAPLVDHYKQRSDPQYIEDVAVDMGTTQQQEEEVDVLFFEASKAVINAGQASTSMLQRRFRIGYNRAARLIEELENKGVVGPADGARPRAVLISMDYLETQFAPPAEKQDIFEN